MTKSSWRARAQNAIRLAGVVARKPLVGARVVNLSITHNCNLACSFCESHGRFMPQPVTARRTYVGGRRQMAVETVDSVCRSLARLGIGRVELSGMGDPIAHPRLPDMIRTIRSHNLECSLITNGTLGAPDLASTLVDRGLARLTLSLNAGTRETYASLAGRDLWAKAVGLLEEVLSRRRAAGAKSPRIQVSFVVCAENINDMDAAVNLCCGWRVEELLFVVMGELRETADIQVDEAGVASIRGRSPGWAARLDAAGVEHNLAAFCGELTRALKMAGQPQENTLQRGLPCYEGWMFSYINPDGTVVPCCYCEDVSLGNVVDRDYEEIWNGPAYQDFRRKSLDMPKTGEPICRECFTSCNRAAQNQRIHRRVKMVGRGR